MTLAMTLPALEAEQCNLPGLSSLFLPAVWLVPKQLEPELSTVTGIPPSPDQLRFGANQEPLSEPVPPFRQLPLLPDPPVWEAEPEALPASGTKPRKGRPAKRRTKSSLSPGQMSLF